MTVPELLPGLTVLPAFAVQGLGREDTGKVCAGHWYELGV